MDDFVWVITSSSNQAVSLPGLGNLSDEGHSASSDLGKAVLEVCLFIILVHRVR